MIFVSVVQRGYTESQLYGPFKTVEEARHEFTDSVTRGDDGDETKYTFFEVKNEVMKEVGYVLFYDECDDKDDFKEEYFLNV
jgi:hypothetical protein